MFPIYQNFPQGEGVEPDTNFQNNAWKSLSIPGYASTTFRQACIGVPVHGLHYGKYVLNSLDFPAAYTYTLDARFSTLVVVPPSNPPTAADFAWDGEKLVPKRERVMVDSIAGGYLCGSTTLIRVPGTQPRTPTQYDIDNALAWKDYALRSTNSGFVLGMELGKGGFIFTTGVGKTFWITFAGSTGSKDVTRKIQFNVVRFGVVGLPSVPYQIEYDTGKKDFQAGGLINANIVGLNYDVPFALRLCDIAKNGTKCALGAHIQHPVADDDGVNQRGSWCVSFAECSFSLGGDDKVTVAGRIVQTYRGDDVATGNSYVTEAGALVRPGTLRRYKELDSVDVDRLVVGGILEDTQVYFGSEPEGKVIFTGTLTTGYALVHPDGSSSGDNVSLANAVLPQGVGQSRRVGNGTSYDIREMRTIHMCYDKDEKLVPITISYTSVDNVQIETTTSVSSSGSGTHKRTLGQTSHVPPDSYGPFGSFVEQSMSSGEASVTVVVERESYTRKCIELRVDGVLVDYFQVEQAMPQRKTTYTKTYGYYGGTATQISDVSDVDNTPPQTPNNAYSPTLPGIAGPLNFVGVYEQVKQAGGIAGHIRNTPVDISDPRAKLRFFVRLESNKLVSAIVGDSGYSVGVDAVNAAETYQYFTEYLSTGKHIKRTVWNCYTGEPAENNVTGHGNPANPAFNVYASEYHSAFNVETRQCVIGGSQPYAFL